MTDISIPFNDTEVGFIEGVGMAPESKNWDELERYIAGVGGISIVGEKKGIAEQLLSLGKARVEASKSVSDDMHPRRFMDSRILTMMELAEALVISEGDLFQTVVTPMSVGLTEIQIRHGDSGVKRDYAALFEALEMYSVLQQIWLSTGIYGQAYPIEFWDSTERLEGIALLNPKHVVIEPISVTGKRPMYFAPHSDETSKALSSDKMFLRAVSEGWNERGDPVSGWKLKPEDVMHIHEYKLAHQIYCIPPLVRAARSISTRAMLEEMIRATIEGVKNQILLYRLENPRPGESAALQSKLKTHRAVRTGYLVWSANLTVDKIMPGSVDELLATETWMRITLDIMRKLGIHLRAISGEVASVGQARDFEVDVQFFVEKLESIRKSMIFWMNRLARRYAKANNIEEPPVILLRPIDLAVINRIKNILVPLMQHGLPSLHTSLEDAGYVPDIEHDLKVQEHEEGWEELFRPRPSFAQDVVYPNRKTTESPQSEGKPSGTEDTNAD